MKKTLTTIFMSSALLATSSLYAAPALQANVNASAAVQAPQAGGLLNNVVQGTQQTLHSAGEHVGQGLHSVKTTTQNTWQNTKQFSNEKAETGKEKAAAAREHAADRTEKTKNSLKQKSAQVQLHSNAQVDVDTPVAKAKVSSKTHTAVGAAQ